MQNINGGHPYLKMNNKITYYFSEEAVLAIFNVCKNLGLRIRDGMFGKSAILPIPPDCAQVMESYLQVRPKIEIDNKYLLFYTDRLNKWPRRSVEQMFKYCRCSVNYLMPDKDEIV